MSVPDQTAINSIIKPEQRHHHDSHQIYSHQHEQHQQNYYDHYDHHQPNSFAPMDHQAYQQPDPQQQWYVFLNNSFIKLKFGIYVFK